jgi:hypothetical protein
MTIRPGRVTLVAAALVFLTLCASARAGRYTIHNCPGSLQPNFDAGAWVAYGALSPGAGGFQGSCTPGSTLGGAIGWYGDEQPLNTNLGVELQTPSQAISIRELRLVWTVAHQSGGSDPFAQVVADTGVQSISATPFSAGAANPMLERLPEGTHTVYVECPRPAAHIDFNAKSTRVHGNGGGPTRPNRPSIPRLSHHRPRRLT